MRIYAEIMFFKNKKGITQRPVLEINDPFRIESLPLVPYLEMQMGSRTSARISSQSYYLPRLYDLPRIY